MRKLILLKHVTPDGFTEDANRDRSGIQHVTDEQWNHLFNVLQEINLFVLGRGMWPDYRDYWKKALTKPGFSGSEANYVKPAQRTVHLIFSHTLADPQWENATIVKGGLKQEVKS